MVSNGYATQVLYEQHTDLIPLLDYCIVVYDVCFTHSRHGYLGEKFKSILVDVLYCEGSSSTSRNSGRPLDGRHATKPNKATAGSSS